MIVDYSLIGKRLAGIRKQKKLTQEKLAEKTGLANNYISNIENNRSIPSIETLVKLCDALDITPNEVLLGTATTSSLYMNDELQVKINQCNFKEKRLICGIIDLLLSEREK